MEDDYTFSGTINLEINFPLIESSIALFTNTYKSSIGSLFNHLHR